MSGYTNNALPREILILQPPERCLLFLFINSSEKPSPCNIFYALASAEAASIYSNRSKIACIFSAASGSLESANYSYSYINSVRSPSVSSTKSNGVLSFPSISYSTSNIWIYSGSPFNSLKANEFIKHVLPIPFLPIKPYFLP